MRKSVYYLDMSKTHIIADLLNQLVLLSPEEKGKIEQKIAGCTEENLDQLITALKASLVTQNKMFGEVVSKDENFGKKLEHFLAKKFSALSHQVEAGEKDDVDALAHQFDS